MDTNPQSIAGIVTDPALYTPVTEALDLLQDAVKEKAAAAGVPERSVVLAVWLTLTRLLISWGGSPEGMMAALMHTAETTPTEDNPLAVPESETVQ